MTCIGAPCTLCCQQDKFILIIYDGDCLTILEQVHFDCAEVDTCLTYAGISFTVNCDTLIATFYADSVCTPDGLILGYELCFLDSYAIFRDTNATLFFLH